MNLDAFALIAELSLGLLGFSGVAAAFGGRERSYNYVERVRLMGVVGHSSFPLFGSLLIYVLAEAGSAPAVRVTSAAAFALAIFLPYFFVTLPEVLRSRRDANTSTETWAVAIVWIQVAVVISLYAMAILSGGRAWPLLAAYCVHLAMGTFVFWRILVRAE